MEQEHVRLIKRLASYTAGKALESNDFSLFHGKCGSSVALFETAGFLGSRQLEDAAAELMEQVLSRNTENIGFADGLSGTGYALLYLIECEYIENDIDKYFGKNRLKIRNVLSRTIKLREPATSASLEILHYLAAILYTDPDEKEKQLAEALIGHTFEQLTGMFDTSRWIEGNHCKPAVIDTFITLLKAIVRFGESGLQHLYDPDLLHKLLHAYASVYQAGYIAHYYTLGHFLGKIAGEKSLWNEIARINRNSALKGMPPRLLSLRKKRELFFLLSENECGTTSSLAIGRFLEERITEADKQDYSGMPYDATDGTSAWLLYKLFRENCQCKNNFSRFSRLIF